MRNKVALAALLICAYGPTPARAHCYARWYYPWPQQCNAHVNRVIPAPMRIWRPDPIAVPTPPIKDEIDIPLPDMAFKACAEPDERTVGIIRLRAKLEGYDDVR